MYFSDKFISAAREYSTLEAAVPAPYIRKTFFAKATQKAEITITGLGFYKLYINGIDITKGLLSPYISNSNDMVYYDNYDISPYLLDGLNTIGIILGNGMQNAFGGFVWDFEKTEYRTAPMTALALELDGKLVMEADESFKTYPSPILEDDLRLGEHYDARCEITGWNLSEFDDSEWKNAIAVKAPKGEKRLSTVRPIKCVKMVKPVNIVREADGYVYDFGINTAGTIGLNIKGYEGQKVVMIFGEVLKDGKFHWENTSFIRPEYADMRPYRQEDVYICKGNSEEYYEPTFTYHGYRYVKVYGISEEQATDSLLTMRICNTELDVNGEFACSDEVLNSVQKMTLNSTISNFYHFPMDCPHREKNGWTADAALSAEQTMLNFAPAENYKEWMRNVCKAQAEDGSLPGIVPTYGWGFSWGNGPAWDCVITEIPHTVYKYTGDAEIIHICKASIIKYLKYVATRRNADGLIAIGLGDWEDPSAIGGKYQAPLELTDSIYSMNIALQAAELMKVIGEKEEYNYCKDFSSSMRESIRNNLLDKQTMTFAGNCQTSQAMGIYYGLLNPSEERKAFEVLEQLIHRDGDSINSGVLGLKVIFHVLSKYGRSDLAYKMITKPEAPSYGFWVRQGNTTLEEYMLGTKSANHHFMGDVSAWFYKCVCGIEYSLFRNEEERIYLQPTLLDELDYAKAHTLTKDGRISLEYEKRGKEVLITVSLPKQMYAILKLPNNWIDAMGRNEFVCGTGKYTVKREEV